MGAAGNGQPQPQPQQPAAEGGPARLHCGVIALTPGCAKVALVRAPPDGGWQFPSAPLPAEAKPGLEAECGVAADVAEQRLGLDVEATLCSQPVITALGPGPRSTTKFFVALNVPEAPLKAAADGGQEAVWRDLQAVLEETADLAVTGNQLVAVLRQLRGTLKRRYELLMPSDDGHQAIAPLLCWSEGEGGWRGPAPKDHLEAYCAGHKLPAPCFNVFEKDRSLAGRTHFVATCLLPHLGLQLTADAVHPSPADALQNAAVLTLLYLEGALAPDCPLVHFAPAGEMAAVPHAFVTERERRQDARIREEEAARRRAVERQAEEEAAALRKRMAGYGSGSSGAEAWGDADRPPKRPKPERAPLTIAQALEQTPPDRNALMCLKEVCEKCRYPQPTYLELPGPAGACSVAVTVQEAGIVRSVGPPHEDRKAAKMLAAQAVLDALRRRHPS